MRPRFDVHENKLPDTIPSGSQQERVLILKMVLTEKGIPTSPLQAEPEPRSESHQTQRPSGSIPQESDDGGIDL